MEMLLRIIILFGILGSSISVKISLEPTDSLEEHQVTISDLFAVCQYVESVNLQGAGITLIPKEIVHSDKIQSISLGNNNIKYVPHDVFKSATQLLCLNLSRNHIPIEQIINFNHKTLKALDISNQYDKYSKREELEPMKETLTLDATYSNFPSLLYLDLSGNEFNIIPNNLSMIVPRLTHLYIRNRSIKDFSERFFNLLPKNLKSLHLENNNITTLYFPENLSIEALFLDGNPLEFSGHIISSSKLKILSLSNCSLNTGNLIDVGMVTLANTPNIESLDLSYNKIENILTIVDSTWFHDLKNLNLAHNEFNDFPLFAAPTKVQKLSVSYNKIRQIPAAIENFSFLKVLNMRCNHINTISVEAFSLMPDLEVLDLYGNELKYLPANWLNRVSKLHYLDLRYNNFISIHNMFGVLPMPYETALKDLYVKSNTLRSTNTNTLNVLPSTCVVHVT